MSPRTEIVGVMGALLTMALIIELVRRRKLRTSYSLIWLFVGASALVMVLWQDLPKFMAWLLGVSTPRTFLFLVGISFSLLILLEHSLTLSILWHQNKNLAQRIALLEWQLHNFKDEVEDSAPSVLSSFEQIHDAAPLQDEKTHSKEEVLEPL